MRIVKLDPAIWLRGDKNSFLLNTANNKQCCVGIYLEQCGVHRDNLAGNTTACKLNYGRPYVLPKECEWLLEDVVQPRWGSSDVAGLLYDANDEEFGATRWEVIPDEIRVATLNKILEDHNIDVRFELM